VFYPNFEPSSHFISKSDNMNADCAPLFNIRMADIGLIIDQRSIQLKNPEEEGVVER
jgi:hypothetical protein